MRILGAILAGGLSSRFGSDKALALYAGKPLIAHVADALARQCESVVLCGPARSTQQAWGGLPTLADHPGPGLGPMAGLCAALVHARSAGFDAVLAAPCDVLGLPEDCSARLSPGPAVADEQWLIGLWPAALAPRLEALLQAEGAISARRWIATSSAAVRTVAGIRNINRPGDLD